MERLIIKGNVVNNNMRLVKCFVVPIILLICFIMIWILNIAETRERRYYDTSLGEYITDSLWIGDCFEGSWWGLFLWGAIIGAIVGVVMYLALKQVEIVVTDKRVYGKTTFGKQVDLPIDSITSISIGIFGKIEVATSSGVIKFVGIKNKNDIHRAISQLIMNRQSLKNKNVVAQEVKISNSEELKKYKDLVDLGIITIDEFEAKKKQLLGL